MPHRDEGVSLRYEFAPFLARKGARGIVERVFQHPAKTGHWLVLLTKGLSSAIIASINRHTFYGLGGSMTTSAKEEKAILERMAKARAAKLREKQQQLEETKDQIAQISRELEAINSLLGTAEGAQ